MNQKTILTVHLLSLILLSGTTLSFTAFATSVGEERKVGVEVGDWGIYGDINVTWSSNDPKFEPDISLILANNTVWFKHVVTDIMSTVIYFRNVTHFRDSPESTNNVWIDVEVGQGNGTLMFVSAGLNAGAPLYEGTVEPVFINETLSRTYAGVEREVNHLNLTTSYRIDTDVPQDIQISLDYYWDKITGILAERQGSYVNQTGNYLTSWYKSDGLVETSLWSSGTIPPVDDAGDDFHFWLLGVALIAVLGVLILYRRQRTKRKVRKHRRPRRH